MRISRRWFPLLVGAAAGVLVMISGSLTSPVAVAGPTSAVADDQATLVEDFSYPGAAQIKDEYGVVLTSGDGHILFADCATDQGLGKGLLQVYTTEFIGANGEGMLCFKVTASAGYLNLLVPAVYEIRGDGSSSEQGHKVKADLTTDSGEHSTVEVRPIGSTPVGIGDDPNNAPTTLLRLESHA
ncbi:hypothetical protein AB0K15_18630 [Amycolatopsis sp. NPDC049253]|uniref:hypothetical protein n=1 Tax=Amycolatopsis sp. NPDC049253 TaxID=3155274 RepID=UPI00342966F6